MNSVLLIRDAARSIYAGYGTYIRPLLKIILAFLMLSVIQKNMGYNEMLSGPLLISAASVLCAFFPGGFISFISMLFVIANMSELSLIMAAFTALSGILAFMLYFGFRPGAGIVIAIVPLMFHFKLPFIVPLILGLSSGLYSAAPAALGVLMWKILSLFSENAVVLSQESSAAADLAGEFMSVSGNVLTDKYMYVTMFAFALCIALVSFIRRSSLKHGGLIAVSAGMAAMVLVLAAGGAVYGAWEMPGGIPGALVSYAAAVFYVYLVYSADFSRTEHLSYEDDDFYYYVKAVPKLKPYKKNG